MVDQKPLEHYREFFQEAKKIKISYKKPQATWADLEEEFDRKVVNFRSLYFGETKIQVLADSGPKIKEISTKGEFIEVRHPNVLPYRKSDDQDHLAFVIAFVESVIPKLEKLIEKRELSLYFVKIWGSFCQSIGHIESVLYASDDDLKSERRSLKSAAAQARPQIVWACAFTHKAMELGYNKTSAIDLLTNQVGKYLKGQDKCPDDFGPEWFAVMAKNDFAMGEFIGLKSTYSITDIINNGEYKVCLYHQSPESYPPLLTEKE